jgi:hypothetical protein
VVWKTTIGKTDLGGGVGGGGVVVVVVINLQSSAVKCVAGSTYFCVCCILEQSITYHSGSVWNAQLSIMALE